MNLKGIREQSIHAANRLGVDVLSTLPLLDDGLEMRKADEAVSRILVMNAVTATAYGFDKAKAIAWLKQESLTDSLSEEEKLFVFKGVGQPDRIKVQVESMWALAWAMGITNELNFAKDCDSHFVTMLPNLKQSQSSTDFRKKANPRPLEQVVAACDLAYCLHWAIRQAELSGKSPPTILKSYVVVERRRALEWLLNVEAWDEVPLNTQNHSWALMKAMVVVCFRQACMNSSSTRGTLGAMKTEHLPGARLSVATLPPLSFPEAARFQPNDDGQSSGGLSDGAAASGAGRRSVAMPGSEVDHSTTSRSSAAHLLWIASRRRRNTSCVLGGQACDFMNASQSRASAVFPRCP